MTDSSQQLADSQEDFQGEASQAVDFQAEEVSWVDSQEGAFRAEVSQEEASRVEVTTFRVADSQEEVSHHLEEAAVEVTNTVHHQAHHLLTHRNKVFPLLRSTLVPLEDADSASRIFG
ncbi:Uncharacterised protein [Mycobacteroides abscessus subsp. abscessus]|nr:Uncharacterised protein [Mycobacteroides abscessus subsp. abscessus]